MVVVEAVDPANDGRIGGRILENVAYAAFECLRVVVVEEQEVGFAMIVVADSYFACYYIGEGIDEDGWRGKEFVWVADG